MAPNQNEMEALPLESLFDKGLTIGILALAVWFLNRRNDSLTEKLATAQEAEMKQVRERLQDCEDDRAQIRREKDALQDRVEKLEKTLDDLFAAQQASLKASL